MSKLRSIGTTREAGFVAGAAGLGLLLAVEILLGGLVDLPVVRYAPPVRSQGFADLPDRRVPFVARPRAEQVEAHFEAAGYDLRAVRREGAPVPRLRLVALPPDLPAIRDVARRKKLFLSIMLPLVLEANSHVSVERKRLRHIVRLRAEGAPLTAELEAWLERLADRYRTGPDRLDVLLRRVDTVPPALALAQAAIESGWGTSRFAQQGNAIFGQWTTAGGKGLVPEEREEGMTHKVRAFDRLSESVGAYLLNLNSNAAYRDFRTMRALARAKDMQPDPSVMAAGLEAYSERGGEYVDLLRSMIRVNRLDLLNGAVLSDEVVGFASGV